ncbi:d-beta-hydroxybutyrate dehydrogenase, mitochondrial [Trichonephila clavipes]|nr:d-beta-hydroxybutyrate dehydrogenase, mitochondrial [Trichonephila clavipes]
MQEKNNSTRENNSTQQQERTTQLISRNETTQLNRRKQLNSSVGTKQLNSALPSTACNRLQPPTTAYNRLQPPTTACNRLHRLQPPATACTACTAFTAESAFSTYLCPITGLYCLINNAGVLAYTDFELMTPKMCEEVININVLGTMLLTKHFLPLICQTPGRIVTITSILARLVYPRVAVYAATKHALSGFFSTLRFELQEKGVHVATVEPGDFSTTTDIMQVSIYGSVERS